MHLGWQGEGGKGLCSQELRALLASMLPSYPVSPSLACCQSSEIRLESFSFLLECSTEAYRCMV